MYNLFVYGTLKRGYGNHRLIEGATFVCNAVSFNENYVMWGTGFPLVAETNRGHPIRGEIYQVDEYMLRACDRLEGHPDWYHRTIRTFIPEQGECKPLLAWIYLQHADKGVRGMFSRPKDDGILEWQP